jgi:hypothetical protein
LSCNGIEAYHHLKDTDTAKKSILTPKTNLRKN